MTPEHKCEIVAAKNHFVLSRQQAFEMGMSKAGIARRLKSGRWRLIYPGVYFIGSGEITWESRLAGACLWGGAEAVISHMAALQLHGLFTSKDHVSITVSKRRNACRGIEVHCDPKGGGRVLRINGIPVTTIERAIVDVCRRSKRPFAVEIVERAIRGKRSNLKRLAKHLENPETRPCRTLAWVLKNRFAYGVTDSEAEDLFIRIVRKHPRCEGWVHHHVVTRSGHHLAELDFAYLPELLNVEIDGDESTPDRYQAQGTNGEMFCSKKRGGR
jgi:predicted RNA-binding protein YlqC (UPF0109 family)